LRTLLRVRDEAGRTLLFRFYDPRVLRAYLPTCTATEWQSVFGPVHQLICSADEDEERRDSEGNGRGMLVFKRDGPMRRDQGTAAEQARVLAVPA
jgi:hypothetical protein